MSDEVPYELGYRTYLFAGPGWYSHNGYTQFTRTGILPLDEDNTAYWGMKTISHSFVSRKKPKSINTYISYKTFHMWYVSIMPGLGFINSMSESRNPVEWKTYLKQPIKYGRSKSLDLCNKRIASLIARYINRPVSHVNERLDTEEAMKALANL